MYVPEGAIMGRGQNWEEEEKQEIKEYSEHGGCRKGCWGGDPRTHEGYV